VSLPRTEVTSGLVKELGNFAELIRTLDAADWATPTRCTGWSVGDVAAHVTGTLADITNGRLDGLGTPEVTEREVLERRGRTAAEVADELEQVTKLAADILGGFDDEAWASPAPAGLLMTLGQGVESLWYDAYLHGDDIRAALGRPSVGGDGVRASVSHVADMLSQQEWGPATLALDGTGEFPVSGGGPRITGAPLPFVLAATGRGDPRPLGLDESVNIYR
jgi:uncharacterized protein (TIGR03083 family)